MDIDDETWEFDVEGTVTTAAGKTPAAASARIHVTLPVDAVQGRIARPPSTPPDFELVPNGVD